MFKYLENKDGFHTFNELYGQREVLFAVLVNTYKDLAWKSYCHEDGELCFGGGWFIVGIDTPDGSYTYHYKNEFWDDFKCKELERGKHWDGHTAKDVRRLMSILNLNRFPAHEQESLDKLYDSFYANFNEGQTDIGRFSPLFKNMAKELRNLKINYAFVDVSRKKNMIDFNLSLDEGLFLSVAQMLNEPSENVMFTIARNHKTIVIDEMPIKELVRKVADEFGKL